MKKITLIAIIMCWGATSLFAQNITDALRPFRGVSGLGARAIALGGAYTSISNDFTATFWNPAGLAQIRKNSIYTSIGHLSHDADISFGSNQASPLTESYTRLDGIGIVYKSPLSRNNMVWAIGRNTLFVFDNRLAVPTGGAGESLSIIETGEIHAWTGAVSVDIYPRTSFGVSVNWLRGSDDYDFRENSGESSISENFTPTYNGFSMIFGGLYRSDYANFGISITAPTIYNVDDSWNILDVYADSSVNYTGSNEYRLIMPFKFNAGISSFIGNTLLAADIHLTDYSQIEFSSEIIDEGVSLDSEINRDISSELRTTVGYSIGLEYLLPTTDLKLRLGLAKDPSPYKDDDGDDRLLVSAGLSVLLDKQVKVDLTFVRTSWETNFSSEFFPQTIKEDASDNRFLLSLSYRY